MAIFLNFIRLLCQTLVLIIFFRVILSWVFPHPNALTVFLDRITEPLLAPLRRIMPKTGMFDFTPLVAIILLQVIVRLLS